MPRLTKTTIIIWTDPEEIDPRGLELDILAGEAINGLAYCSRSETEFVDNPQVDPDWDGTDFFDDRSIDDDEEEDEA